MIVSRGWSLTGNVGVPRADRRGHLVLVGECPAPNWNGKPDHIMTGGSFCGIPGTPGQLAKSCGLSYRQYFEVFDRTNVYDQKARAWRRHHRDRARSNADRILDQLCEGREIIVVGRRAAQAFGLEHADFLSSHEIETEFGMVPIHLAPHPSGKNHWWNDPQNRWQAARFLRGIVRRAAPCYA